MEGAKEVYIFYETMAYNSVFFLLFSLPIPITGLPVEFPLFLIVSAWLLSPALERKLFYNFATFSATVIQYLLKSVRIT